MAQEEEEEEDCPLFMTGLPSSSSFERNPALAALSSLVGGKSSYTPARSTHAQQKRKVRRDRAAPYLKREGRKKQHATLGEAQIYLSLWSKPSDG